MDTILEILETIKPGADFASSTDFIEEHLLESMEILQLVSELNDEFDINITLPYIKPENFKSVESIYNIVQEKIRQCPYCGNDAIKRLTVDSVQKQEISQELTGNIIRMT